MSYYSLRRYNPPADVYEASTLIGPHTGKKTPTLYKGWAITYSAYAPVTGQWKASRQGVGLCAGSLDALKRMIDTRPA